MRGKIESKRGGPRPGTSSSEAIVSEKQKGISEIEKGGKLMGEGGNHLQKFRCRLETRH